MKPKEVNAKGGIKSTPASVSSELSRDPDHPVADHTENGHESAIAAFSDVGSPEDTHDHPEVVSDIPHDPTVHEEVHPNPKVHPEEQPGEHPAEDETHGHEHVGQTPPDEVSSEHEQVRLEVHEDSVPEPPESHAGQVLSNGAGVKVEPIAPGSDIEDIVNLLEGTSLSKPRPQSIVTIPDEDGEILAEY